MSQPSSPTTGIYKTNKYKTKNWFHNFQVDFTPVCDTWVAVVTIHTSPVSVIEVSSDSKGTSFPYIKLVDLSTVAFYLENHYWRHHAMCTPIRCTVGRQSHIVLQFVQCLSLVFSATRKMLRARIYRRQSVVQGPVFKSSMSSANF